MITNAHEVQKNCSFKMTWLSNFQSNDPVFVTRPHPQTPQSNPAVGAFGNLLSVTGRTRACSRPFRVKDQRSNYDDGGLAATAAGAAATAAAASNTICS